MTFSTFKKPNPCLNIWTANFVSIKSSSTKTAGAQHTSAAGMTKLIQWTDVEKTIQTNDVATERTMWLDRNSIISALYKIKLVE